jgi:hypothetical protein
MASLAERTRGRQPTGLRHDDADETVGTIESDDAVGFDPLPVLQALDARRAPAVVMGQVAGILHGSTELTGDLDLLWSGLPGDAPGMAAAFSDLDAELSDDDGRVVDVSRAFFLAKVQFRTASAAGDCCTPRLPWNGLDVAAFIERADGTEIDGVVVRYLSLQDLIAMRRATARPKDLRRAVELERLTGVFDAHHPGSSGGARFHA